MGPGNILPEEIVATQEWLHEMFKEAGRGLPLPYQMGLLVVEQALVVGMFGGLLTSAWFLNELRQKSDSTGTVPDIGPILHSLEQVVLSPLPPAVQAMIRQVAPQPLNLDDLERVLVAFVSPLLNPKQSGAG